MKRVSLLKKVFCSIVLTMLFIVSVKAFSTNLKEVKVIETNMDITNISTNDNQITDDIIFEEKDDYIVLEFTLQNNDDYKYTIENIVDNNTNENIEITYDYSKEEIKEKSQYKFKARLEYKNRLENVRQIDIDDLKITLKLIRDDGKEKDILVRNPKTGDSILLYLLLIIVALITFILIKVKKKKIFGYSLFLLLITILLPIGIFAVQRYEYDILFKNISIKGVMLPYDVKFHVLDKDPITEVVIYGDEIGTLPEVNEPGYNFVEWQDKDGNKVDEHTVIRGDLDVYAKLNLITYNINYDLNTGSLDEGKENPSTYNVESEDIVLNNPKKLGYNFAGWTGSNGETLQTEVTIEKGSIGDKNYKANFIARDDTKYTVIHRKQKLILTEYETAEVERLRGVTDTTIRPQTKTYRGFVSPEPEDLTITADGDALLVYDYKRMYYDYLVDVNTDSTIPTGSYPFETEATISPKNIPGYTFNKWSDDETDNTRTIIIDENTIRLKPLYTPNPDTPYMVIHKYQKLDLVSYEEEVENKTGTTDTSVTPGIRIREGFENPTLQTVNINGDGSTVVTYIYNRKYYNFTLEDPNNTNSTLPTGSYPYETEITVSPKAIPGYTFDKWNDGNKEKPRTIILVEDTSIKPIYKPNTNTPYVVNHYKQKLTLDGYDLADTDNLTGTTDTKVTPNTKTYTGFTSPTKVEITIKGDGTTVLNYNYDRKNYSFSLTNRVDAEASVVDGSYPYETHIILDIHDKPGYDFVGWSDGDTNTRREIILTKDTEIGPVFNARTDTEYKVQHKKMNLNGSGYTLEETELLSGTTDTNVTPAVKTYTGFTSPSTKTAKIKGDGTTVIEYLYTRNKYQLTYGDKNYTDLDYSTAEGKYYYETEIKIKAKAKTGYTFKKWNNGDTNSTTTFNIVKDTTITPIYEANKYNVVFNSNTGTGTMSNQQMTYDVETKLSKNTFTKTGYTFSKWNTKEDGTGTNYNDEATVKNLATSGNKILYAVWTANELVFNNQTLNTGTYGTAYTSNAFVGATNGTGNYKYTIKSGAPEGATINSTNRTISFPATTVAGTYNVVVTAKDNTSGKSKDATMKIVINTATPTVTLTPKSAVYTGSAIAANTATVSPNSNPTITYTYYNGTSCTGTALSGAPTNVGTYSVKAHAAAVTNKTNVADSACVAHTITQAPTTTTMSAVTKTYTGSAQAASGASAKLNSNNSSISGGSYTYTYYNGNSCSGTALSGAPITAGTYSVKATLTATTNYASSTSSCALYTMNKSATTTTMSAITKTYNGSAQAASGATSKLSSNNTAITGGSYTYTYYSGNSCSGTALTSAPTNAGTYSVKATLTGTTNYNASTSSCVTYTMNAKSVTLTAGTSSRAWNGSALTNNTCTANTGGLLSGHTVTCTMTSGSTITNVGSVDNVINTYTIKSGSTDLTSNYIVATTKGKLTITAATPTVTLTPKSAVYTGSAIAANTATVSPNSNPTITYTYYNGTSCTGTALSGAPTNVGTYSVKAHAAAVTNKTNVADSACVAHTITQAPTTTTMSAVTKTYTGSAQAASGASAKLNSNNSSISGGSYTYTYYNGNSCSGTALSGAPITAGTYSVKATLTATTNYASSTSSCALYTMNKSATTTTMSAITKTYNGSAQAASGATSKLSSNNTAISGGSYTYTYYSGNSCSGTALTSAPTNAGTYSVKATLTGTTNYNASTSSCVTYTMNAKSVTLTAGTSSRAWNGSALTNNTCTANTGGLLSGHTVTCTMTSGSTITNVGSVDNVINTYTIKSGSTDLTSNYIVATTKGKLTITAATPTVTLTPKSAVYTGSAIAANTATVSPNSNPTITYTYYNGTSCTGTALSGAPTNVGTYSVKAHAAAVTNKTNVADSACVAHTITQAPTTTTMSAVTKTYTGSAQAASGASAKLNSNNSSISGGSYTYTYYNGNSCSGTALSGAPITAGTYSVKATLTATTNYASSTSSCALYTMNKSATTTTMSAITKTYNGSAQAASGATSKLSSNNTAITGGSYTYTYYSGNSCSGTALTSAPTNAGTYSVKATLTGTTNYNASTSSCVTYTMNAKSVTLTAGTSSRAWNGSALTNNTCTANTGGLLSGHTVTCTMTSGSTITNVGSVDNVINTYTIKSGSTDLTSNYIVATTKGKLTITAATPTVTLTPKSAVYTGSAIAANTATVSPNSNPTITYTYYNGTSCTGTALSGAPTNVGTYSVKAHAAAVTNKTNVADSACVAHTITQAPTTTTMSAVTKTYTGSAQAASGASAKLNSNNSSISGGSYTYTYYSGNSCSGTALSGAPITAGTYSVKATLTATTNYASSTSGCVTYTMNKKAITIKAKDQTIDFGSTISKTTSDVTVTTLVSGDSLTGITLTQSTTNPTTSGKITPSAAVIKKGTTDVTSSYSITYTDGVLKINNRPDTITITNKTYIYDGSGKATTASATSGSTVSLTYYSDSSCSTKTTTTNATSAGGTPKAVGTYYAIGTTAASTSYTAGNSGCKKAVEINNAKLTFNATTNGGTLSGTGTLYTRTGSNKVYTGIKNSTTATIPTASKTNYIFDGWYTSATGGSKVLNADGSFTGTAVSGYTSSSAWSTTSDKTLYAQYKVKEATFASGITVNTKMKKLAGTGTSYSSYDTNITSIVKSLTPPNLSLMTDDNIVSSSGSEPIYMWYNNGTIYWWSQCSTVYLNSWSNYMFSGLKSLQTLDLRDFDSSKVTNFESFLSGCNSLTSINLTGFNTGSATNMCGMFSGCSSLTSLDVTHFDTSKVYDMSNLFSRCKNLASLDVSHFDTSNAKDISGMFSGCSSLTSLDVTHFDTSKVTSMNSLFYNCNSLTTLNLSNFDTSKVTDTDQMFCGCSSLTNLNLSNFDTSKVNSMRYMFKNCSNLTNLNVSSFNTSNVENMNAMFGDCSKLTSLDLSSFNTSKVTDMNGMFYNCDSLTNLDLSSFDIRQGPNIEAIVSSCDNLEIIDLSSFDTSNISSISYLFSGCSKLKTIYASNKFVTTNITSSDNMFYDNRSIVGGSGTTYDDSHRDKLYARIDGGTSNPGYFTYKAYSGPTGASISKVSNMIKNNGNKIVLLGSAILFIILGIVLKLVNRKKKS